MVALLEVLLCSDYPTQIALASTLAVLGFQTRTDSGTLDITYIVLLSLADTCVLLGLIVLFLAAHGERFGELLFGSRPISTELLAGVPLTLVSLALAMGVLVVIQFVAPALHTVEHNPLQELLQTRADALLFGIVVVVAGGVREEIQRAFILRRFEQSLGGAGVGVVVASVAFGAGHLLQGVDAAIATGLLGAFWGIVYLRRRSVVAPVVSHSGFNLLELVQFLTMGK
jgi:membrane protease YdiL (CAAX protease family)